MFQSKQKKNLVVQAQPIKPLFFISINLLFLISQHFVSIKGKIQSAMAINSRIFLHLSKMQAHYQQHQPQCIYRVCFCAISKLEKVISVC